MPAQIISPIEKNLSELVIYWFFRRGVRCLQKEHCTMKVRVGHWARDIEHLERGGVGRALVKCLMTP